MYKFHFVGDKSTRICGTANIDCYNSAIKKLYGENVIDDLEDKRAQSFRQKCDCMPACTSITYDAGVDRNKIELKEK